MSRVSTRRVLLPALALAAAASLTGTAGALAAPAGKSAGHGGDTGKSAAHGKLGAGSYIVVMRADAAKAPTARVRASRVARLDEVISRVRQGGGHVGHRYTNALTGFAGRLTAAQANALAADPAVASVSRDGTMSIGTVTQYNAPWNLDRLDQTNLPLNHRYVYARTGYGVTAYVIDTGLRTTHHDFTGRVGSGFTAISDGRGNHDCNGHGTHVSGTIGGTRYGVAKRVRIVPVRVLDCGGSGSNSGVIDGIDWVAAQHTPGHPAVANLSLGGNANDAVDQAIKGLVEDGVTVAVAAGNDGVDACTHSPARAAGAITVGATTANDVRAYYSNTGRCVDIFAPGHNVTSDWWQSDTQTNTISGTSMATPAVSGLAALYLQAYPSANPAQVTDALIGVATKGKVKSAGTGSPNLLARSVGTLPAPAVMPSDNPVANAGFESGSTGWSASSGVIGTGALPSARTGTWKAWLGGHGTTATDTLSQTFTLPNKSAVALMLPVLTRSNEDPSGAYDELQIHLVVDGTDHLLGHLTNQVYGSRYVRYRLDISAYRGKSATLNLVGTEDSSNATSWFVDDVWVIHSSS